jgi:GT2 family glycosyltransferase
MRSLKPVKQAVVQAEPVQVPLGTGKPGLLKVDVVVAADGMVAIAGWRVGAVEVALEVDGAPVAVDIHTVDRGDVAAARGASTPQDCGFVLVAENVGGGELRLAAGADSRRVPAEQRYLLAPVAAEQIDRERMGALGPVIAALARRQTTGSPAWRRLVEAVPSAPSGQDGIGHIDAAAVVRGIGQALVVGWVAVADGVQVWLEDDAGGVYALDGAYRFQRRDVYERLADGPLCAVAAQAAFVLRIQTPADIVRLRLVALGPQGRSVLSEMPCSELPRSSTAVVSWLFGANTPRDDLAARFTAVDQPVLEAIAAVDATARATLPVRCLDHGEPPAAPRASVIVPLYGRHDFVESQMLEWARDPAIGREVEIVYVVDDPGIMAAFAHEAAGLHRLYGVPFRVVDGLVNRGFSGANNLGAEHSRGDVLVFLNSDAFPRRPGWVGALCDLLAADPTIGAVGPRLIMASGGIQHAGMRFQWLPEFGIWANVHPGAGLDPALDPATGPTDVPAVTGACLAVRRDDFVRVGGWDTGYVIGDFEDSDLCLKLRALGRRIVYQPDVELTHLERQSFALLGGGEFRQQVVLVNALRHQQRWADLLATEGNGR